MIHGKDQDEPVKIKVKGKDLMEYEVSKHYPKALCDAQYSNKMLKDCRMHKPHISMPKTEHTLIITRKLGLRKVAPGLG
jgi:hypothetical protein